MKISKKKQQDSTDPQVKPESCVSIPTDDIIENFLLRTRRLLLVGEINEVSSTYVCNYLQGFSLINEPVYMYINSHGGCLASGYAIVDQMLACGCPVYTIVRGQAHSMGAIIAAFGTKGHRYATPNSSIMLHSITIQNPPSSIEHHIEAITYIQNDYRKKITDMAKRLKLNTKQLMELMNETKWMSPKQATEIGLIDKIWTPRMEQTVNKGLSK
jgi:ATP-dependent Clp protease protease subunit